MNKTIFATLALIGLCGLVACNDPGPTMGSEEEAAQEQAMQDAEILAMQEPASAEPAATEVLEAPAAPVPQTPFRDNPGSTLRYRNVGTVGSCDVYEVQVAERSYILTQNTYQGAHTPTCQITPR